jgi:hypothetical protein
MDSTLAKHGRLPPFVVGLHGRKLEQKEVYLGWKIMEKKHG